MTRADLRSALRGIADADRTSTTTGPCAILPSRVTGICKAGPGRICKAGPPADLQRGAGRAIMMQDPFRQQGKESTMTLQVYLSGEIHSDWRNEIINGARDFDIAFSAPVTDHAASDDCGVAIMGPEEEDFWADHKGAKLNAIRTRRDIARADLVVVRFGERYRQWNAAFDAGYASALGKAIVVMHPPEHGHALKEVDAAALAVVEHPEQVVQILTYVLEGTLPR